MGQDENTNPFNGNETPVFETPTPTPAPEAPAPAPAPIPVTKPGQVSESVSQLSSYNRLGMRPSRNLSAREELDRIAPKAPVAPAAVAKEKGPRDPKIKIIIVLVIVTAIALVAMLVISAMSGNGGIFGGKKNSINKDDLASYVKYLQYGKESSKNTLSKEMAFSDSFLSKLLDSEESDETLKEYATEINSLYAKLGNNDILSPKTIMSFVSLDYDISEIDKEFRKNGQFSLSKDSSSQDETTQEKQSSEVESLSEITQQGIADYKEEYIKMLNIYKQNGCIANGEYIDVCLLEMRHNYAMFPDFLNSQKELIAMKSNLRTNIELLAGDIYNDAINLYTEITNGD